MNKITAESLTFAQIRALRSEAAEAHDYDMLATCDLAINGTINTDDYTVLTSFGQRKLGTMTRDEAYELIAKSINSARALADT